MDSHHFLITHQQSDKIGNQQHNGEAYSHLTNFTDHLIHPSHSITHSYLSCIKQSPNYQIAQPTQCMAFLQYFFSSRKSLDSVSNSQLIRLPNYAQ